MFDRVSAMRNGLSNKLLRAGRFAGLTLFGALAGATIATSAPAYAENSLRVLVDQAQIVPLVTAPSMVIVGNPMIADATIHNGNILVIHGKNYGTTNIVVLDHDSQEIANLALNVVTSGNHELSLYRGSARITLNCAPRCEHELNVGDSLETFKMILEQVSNKGAQASGAAEAPAEGE